MYVLFACVCVCLLLFFPFLATTASDITSMPPVCGICTYLQAVCALLLALTAKFNCNINIK